jgi:hypothetical protein
MDKKAVDNDGRPKKDAKNYITSTGITFEKNKQGGVYLLSFNGSKESVSFELVITSTTDYRWTLCIID